ncbi:hypothetical protein [Psychrobacter sp. DAB_AL43B]|uniref:hypothetical protein n=1 Tax=Psychrobacter sp. DAB_AL43B TaxID=1028416 RepID=UPI0009C3310C|nr:hypothetical protein [Psychrobacter sp. DAB_AL43B]SLJ83391.1 hypothetical protein DABAL43B_0169 [Psychrobacter sp. DAB_AL43B]
MWNKTLQTFMVSTIMAVGVSLSACDSTKDSDATTQEVSTDASKQNAADTLKQESAATNADLDGATPPRRHTG